MTLLVLLLCSGVSFKHHEPGASRQFSYVHLTSVYTGPVHIRQPWDNLKRWSLAPPSYVSWLGLLGSVCACSQLSEPLNTMRRGNLPCRLLAWAEDPFCPSLPCEHLQVGVANKE